MLLDTAGVAFRPIRRSSATLAAQGARIDARARLGHIRCEGVLLPPLTFSDDEVDALILGLRLVADRDDAALVQAANAALARIEAVLPEEHADEAERSGMIAARGRPAAPHLVPIRSAIREERKVRLRYSDQKGVATARTIWPIALGFFADAEVLAAWCETRRDFRHFRLDRIAGLDVTDERYPRRRRVLLADWRLTLERDGLE